VTHLLDTNSGVDHLRRGQSSQITAKLAAAVPGSVVLCSVVVAELLYGAHRSSAAVSTLPKNKLGASDSLECKPICRCDDSRPTAATVMFERDEHWVPAFPRLPISPGVPPATCSILSPASN
jgi:predicted nucleic acid-binding protein